MTYTFSTHDHNKNTVWCTASTKELFFDFMQYVLDNSNNPAAYTIVENKTGKAANLETIAAYYNMRKRSFSERMENIKTYTA